MINTELSLLHVAPSLITTRGILRGALSKAALEVDFLATRSASVRKHRLGYPDHPRTHHY